LPQKSDLSFTPGFSPVITGQKDSGTVSTVFFLRKSPKRLNAKKLRHWPQGKTVETVALCSRRRNTGLKPGVNERYPLSDF
jgi:hypothetical protein